MEKVWSGVVRLVIAVVLAAGHLAPSSARAFEVLDLGSDAPRVGVIVLAYNDDWSSHLGEWIYEGYLRGLMKKRYSKLFVARGKGLTADEVRGAFAAARDTGLLVDFMTSTHSDRSKIQLGRGVRIRPDELLSPLVDPATRERLDLAANFGCNSDGQIPQFEALGFRSYVSHEGISVGAVAMRDFLRRWLRRCDDMQSAIEWTNRHLHRMFTRNPFAILIYRKLSGEDEYTAVMKGWGENRDLCDR